MTYTLDFPETGANQNGQQGATITGTVICATDGETVYYNAANPNGTTTAPTGSKQLNNKLSQIFLTFFVYILYISYISWEQLNKKMNSIY